jgi:hypothetical protein
MVDHRRACRVNIGRFTGDPVCSPCKHPAATCQRTITSSRDSAPRSADSLGSPHFLGAGRTGSQCSTMYLDWTAVVFWIGGIARSRRQGTAAECPLRRELRGGRQD